MAPKTIRSRRSTLRETQRKWTEKLRHVGLDKFNRVCTFSGGAFSHVSLVQLDGHPESAFALKTMPKTKLQRQSVRKRVMAEKEILSQVRSDFVVKLYRTFKDKKFLHFLTEYCPGGDLYGLDPFDEDAARFYVACVVEALDCLHSQDIVHNDLKPENLVLDEKGYVKLIDMGFARKLERGKFAYDSNGTGDFLPPEVAWTRLYETETPNGRDRAVDLWALGVIVYEFLSGKAPFEDNDNGNKMQNIMKGIGTVDFPKGYFSDEVEDLIRKLCCLDASMRLGYESIDEIRQHPWFDNFDWVGLRKRELQPPREPEVVSTVDTAYFSDNCKIPPGSDVEEDESDWDSNF